MNVAATVSFPALRTKIMNGGWFSMGSQFFARSHNIITGEVVMS